MNLSSKIQAIQYAMQAGWTKADARRAFDGLQFPADQIAICNAMIQFAGPELFERQRKLAAQRARVRLLMMRLAETDTSQV